MNKKKTAMKVTYKELYEPRIIKENESYTSDTSEFLWGKFHNGQSGR
jgi:hypothetical protein